MNYLLATASVHTTAAAADYLEPRLTAADTVVVLTVDEPDLAERPVDVLVVGLHRGDPAAAGTLGSTTRAFVGTVDVPVVVVPLADL